LRSTLRRAPARLYRHAYLVIARGGRPIARLVPFTTDFTPRQPGALQGRIHVSDDFDAPLPPELLAAFLGDV